MIIPFYFDSFTLTGVYTKNGWSYETGRLAEISLDTTPNISTL